MSTRADATARTARASQGISCCSPFQWRSVASSNAAARIPSTVSAIRPRRMRTAGATPRAFSIGLRRERGDDLIGGLLVGVVLGDVGPQFGQVRIVRREGRYSM